MKIKKIETKVFIEVKGRKFPGLVKDEHTVCSEPGENYLFHFVPEESDFKKLAEITADHLVKRLKEKYLYSTFEAVGCDITNVNTKWTGGV